MAEEKDKAGLAIALAGIGAVTAIGAIGAYAILQRAKAEEAGAGGGVGGVGGDITQAGNLIVHVTDPYGYPVKDANITLTTLSTAQQFRFTQTYNPVPLATFSATTNENGIANFKNIPALTYTMTVTKAGYNTYTTSVTVIANQTITQTVTLAIDPSNPPTYQNTIRVWLLWKGHPGIGLATGDPITNVEVIAYDAQSREIARGITDQNGMFSFKYNFKDPSTSERITFITLESIFEPYLRYLLSPTAITVWLRYDPKDNLPPVELDYDEENIMNLTLVPLLSISNESWYKAQAFLDDRGIPHLMSNSNFPVVVLPNNAPVSAYVYLPDTLSAFCSKKGIVKYLAPFKRSDLSYPAPLTQISFYKYTGYPHFRDIQATGIDTYWNTDTYKAIMPHKFLTDTSGILHYVLLLMFAPIRLSYTDPWEYFKIEFISCAYCNVIKDYVFKKIPVKKIDLTQLPVQVDYFSIEGEDLVFGTYQTTWNKTPQEPYVIEYACPPQWAEYTGTYQIIEDAGVRHNK